MLTSLILERWKSIESAELNIDTLTVLIGTNASGKSNLLDALAFLNRIASGVMLTTALQGDIVNSPLRGGLEWAAQKPGDTFAIGVKLRINNFEDIEYRIECKVKNNQCEVISEHLVRNKYRIKKHSQERGAKSSTVKLFFTDSINSEIPTITARIYNTKGGTPRTCSRSSCVLFQLQGQILLNEVQSGIEEMLKSLRNIYILDPIPSHMRGFSALSESLTPDASNIAGILAALPEDRKLKVEQILTRYVSQLPERDVIKVWAEPAGRFNADAMLYCEERYGSLVDSNIVDARGMSDGTLRFLAILTALLTRPQNSLLVVEEIDNGLHPSRSNLLLTMLKEVGEERSVDVMVTTHNPALLDAMGTEMVPFITVAHRDARTGATKLTLLEDVRSLPKLLAQGLVGKIASKGLIDKALQDASQAGDA